MHYLTLVTAEIPALEADLQTDQEMAKHITALEQERKNYTEGPPVILSLALEACNSRRDTFSRAITDSVAQSLERYYAGTDDPDYLEFWDQQKLYNLVILVTLTASGCRKDVSFQYTATLS